MAVFDRVAVSADAWTIVEGRISSTNKGNGAGSALTNERDIHERTCGIKNFKRRSEGLALQDDPVWRRWRTRIRVNRVPNQWRMRTILGRRRRLLLLQINAARKIKHDLIAGPSSGGNHGRVHLHGEIVALREGAFSSFRTARAQNLNRHIFGRVSVRSGVVNYAERDEKGRREGDRHEGSEARQPGDTTQRPSPRRAAGGRTQPLDRPVSRPERDTPEWSIVESHTRRYPSPSSNKPTTLTITSRLCCLDRGAQAQSSVLPSEREGPDPAGARFLQRLGTGRERRSRGRYVIYE